jgi:hypothetical protein
MIEKKYISGNFADRSRGDRQGDGKYSVHTRRPLAEEYDGISISDVRHRFNRKELLHLAERERAIRVQAGNRHYEIMLSAERYQQKWRRSGWSDVTRIWLKCFCGRRTRRLFGDPRSSEIASTLACRACLRLRYMSQNSGKTIWFRNIVLPIRCLYRKRRKLLAQKPTQRVLDQLRFVENQIQILISRAERKTGSVSGSGKRRRYKDIRLILDCY